MQKIHAIFAGMKKFLLIQTRPEDEVSDDEYRTFLEYGKLDPKEVHRLRAEHNGIPADINLDDYAAVIFGGSPFCASDPQEKKSEEQKKFEQDAEKLLTQIIAEDKPFLGACYGVGPVTLHQGGVVSDKFKEDVGAIDITITNAGKSDPLLKDFPETFRAIVGHKESCEVVPKSATVLATGEKCPMQMMRIGKNVYITQFHPELDTLGVKVRLKAYRHYGYCEPEEVEEIVSRVAGEKDLNFAWKILENFVTRYRS